MKRNNIFAEAFKKGQTSIKYRGKTYNLPEWQLSGTVTQCVSYVKVVEKQLLNGEYKIENNYVVLL